MGLTKLLFQQDSYATSFNARIISIRQDGGLVFDQTLFYYTSGGQPCDFGRITKQPKSEDKESPLLQASVIDVKKVDGEIAHYISESASNFKVGDSIFGEIDWARRYRLMRMHTAGHVLSSVFFRKGVLITGNQLGVDKSRFDFSMEQFDRELINSMILEANKICSEGHIVKAYELSREDALKLPGVVKLAGSFPPSLELLRIVEIEGVDIQADGGTHVKNTAEVGEIELVGVENKGAKNRRIYFSLKP